MKVYDLSSFNNWRKPTAGVAWTVGFVQVRLEVLAIGSSAFPGFCSGLTNFAKHWFLLYIFIKIRALVRAEGILIPHLHKALTLYVTLFGNIARVYTALNFTDAAPAILAHLQGTQNPNTKPTLQKS